jgi:hypothetical protein
MPPNVSFESILEKIKFVSDEIMQDEIMKYEFMQGGIIQKEESKLKEDELKSKTILMGFGLDSDAIHSPNEHFGIWNYLKGIETIPQFYHFFTEMSK